ncbi:hypothetical protein [Sediminibacterium soli]|nr:hypothetical protein [Sediminibacterium soli]NCI46903.1 hypothetical protein [Sediminibacterium soli]
MQGRRRVSVLTILLIALAIGFLLKNVRLGLIVGLGLGLIAGGLISGKR